MFEQHNIVKLALIIYLIFGIFVFILLWRNSRATDSIQNAGILLAGLIPALIAVLSYLKPTITNDDFELVLFYNESSQSLIYTNLFDPYTTAYMDLFTNLNERHFSFNKTNETNNTWSIFHKNQGMDFIERLLLLKYIKKFHMHWDIELNKKIVPTGMQITGKYKDTKSRKVSIREITKNLNHNPLLYQEWGSISIPSTEVPHNIKVQFKINPYSREYIIIKPGSFNLKINIIASTAAPAPSGVWGLVKPDEDLRILQYTVYTSFRYNKNTINGERYKHWYNNIKDELNSLDWGSINKEVESSLLRKMLEKQF